MISIPRERIEIQITEEDRNYIDEIKKDFGLSNRHFAISKIISEHKGLDIEKEIDEIKKEIKINKKILNELEKNTNIILEILNSINVSKNFTEHIPIKEFESTLYKEAKESVELDIEKKLEAMRRRRSNL